MKKKLPIVIFSVIIIAGLLLAAYPSFSNFINQLTSEKTVVDYKSAVQETDTTSIDAMLQKAYQYNESLAAGANTDKEYDVDNIINVEGIIGYIYIPKIKVYLPIYNGTESEELAKGVGHLDGTSLPVGGASTHSVLAGHRGLPSAALLTSLDEMEIGDYFVITVLNQQLVYQVDSINTVLPEETQYLSIEKDRDLVTLLTCTPYAINTHRLLVRGTRVSATDFTPPSEEPSMASQQLQYGIYIGLICLSIAAVLLYLLHRKKKKSSGK